MQERGRRACGRCGLEVRTDHRSNKSRDCECSQAHDGDADTSRPRCLPVGVERTHEVDIRERDVAYARAGPLSGCTLRQDAPALGPPDRLVGSPTAWWPASTGPLRSARPTARGPPWPPWWGSTPAQPRRPSRRTYTSVTVTQSPQHGSAPKPPAQRPTAPNAATSRHWPHRSAWSCAVAFTEPLGTVCSPCCPQCPLE